MEDDVDMPNVPEAEETASSSRPTLQLDKKTELGFCAFFRSLPQVRPWRPRRQEHLR